ncbi:nuclear transport factor 2 family protein [Aquimarina spongiae]|uniref:SnoaL-like domain-containing protein n=1 Tax=Aquimarina spongiae TaxID=570521 RepID=A0A1M6AM10_9FLAO|nr:nuclear transport factor 2 family protein [Aquimarina spongiae]SHI37471.1 hypothetical protein SAMN04488508_101363 [Aquimarina spongiae]
MTKEEVAHNYLDFLQNGDIDQIVELFTDNGVVVSPLYGTKPAKDFYTVLKNDTNRSILRFDGLFFEEDTNRISLLFDYYWEISNGETVQFKVVDIIELSPENKIEKLTIIYDTVHSRKAIEDIKRTK